MAGLAKKRTDGNYGFNNKKVASAAGKKGAQKRWAKHRDNNNSGETTVAQ